MHLVMQMVGRLECCLALTMVVHLGWCLESCLVMQRVHCLVLMLVKLLVLYWAARWAVLMVDWMGHC